MSSIGGTENYASLAAHSSLAFQSKTFSELVFLNIVFTKKKIEFQFKID